MTPLDAWDPHRHRGMPCRAGFAKGYEKSEPARVMVKVLITGGAGFIGSNLAKQCRDIGLEVSVLDNLSTGFQENLEALEGLGVEVHIGDVRDRVALTRSIQGCDAVVHLAAQVSVPVSIAEPEETMSINVDGTAAVIDACMTHGVNRLVVASSAAVYGDLDLMPLKEEITGRLLSPYAESKSKNEEQILEARESGLNAVALRFFNVYGAGQRPDGAYAAVIPTFVQLMATGHAPVLNGDGLQTRDFIHVVDVCHAIITLIQGEWRAHDAHVYNVASQTEVTLLQLVDCINASLALLNEGHQPLIPVHGPEREGDIRHSMADISRLSSVLGWSPTVDFQSGIHELVQRIVLNEPATS